MIRAAVGQYSTGSRRGDFPLLVARVTSNTPLWDWAAVAKWLHQHDKLTRETAIEAEAVKAANTAIEAHDTKIGEKLKERLKAYEASLESA